MVLTTLHACRSRPLWPAGIKGLPPAQCHSGSRPPANTCGGSCRPVILILKAVQKQVNELVLEKWESHRAPSWCRKRGVGSLLGSNPPGKFWMTLSHHLPSRCPDFLVNVRGTSAQQLQFVLVSSLSRSRIQPMFRGSSHAGPSSRSTTLTLHSWRSNSSWDQSQPNHKSMLASPARAQNILSCQCCSL